MSCLTISHGPYYKLFNIYYLEFLTYFLSARVSVMNESIQSLHKYLRRANPVQAVPAICLDTLVLKADRLVFALMWGIFSTEESHNK